MKRGMLILLLLSLVGVIGGRVSAETSLQPPPSSGTCRSNIHADIDDIVEDAFDRYLIPGMTLAVTQDGAIVCEKGYGYRRVDTQQQMEPYTVSRIGSVNKVLTALGMMHLIQETPDLYITSSVYGNILTHPDYEAAYLQGVRRQYPIVGQTIGNNGNVITWYSDGTYTVGDSSDLDSVTGARTFTLPSTQTMDEVVGIARGADDRVYSWYSDGTYSIGTPADLDAELLFGTYNSNRKDKIIGVSLDKANGRFYAYYHDGKVTSGTSPDDLKSRWDGETRDYVVPGNQDRRYDIVGVARTVGGRSIVWFSDGMASRGSVLDLGEDTALYAYERLPVTGSREYWTDQYESIQLRHLMSHTSGLSDSGDVSQAVTKYDWSNWDENFNQLPYKDIHRYVLSTRPLMFEPGTSYSYSNHGMGLVGHLIEELTGEDWYDYLHENVLQPAGAGSIRPYGTIFVDAPADRTANPHTVVDGQLVVGTYQQQNHSGSAAGHLMASAGDLARVMLATDRDAVYPDVLDDASIALMQVRWFPDAAPNRLLGWSVTCQSTISCGDNRKLFHDGVTGHGIATIARYDNFATGGVDVDGVSVALVVNGPVNGGFGTTPLYSMMNDIAELTALSIIPPTAVHVQSADASSNAIAPIAIMLASLMLATRFFVSRRELGT